MIKIMFVCHGNICRSPMAEFIFKNFVKNENLEQYFIIDSTATSLEEIDNDIYGKAKSKLLEKGIPFQKRKAKQFTKENYQEYDYIFVMDKNNLVNLNHIILDSLHKVKLISEFSSNFIDEIADPWYTDDFETAFLQIYDCCKNILKYILSKDKTEIIEECFQKNLIYDGRIIKLYNDDVLISNKQVQREYVAHPGGVCAVPYDEQGNIYLVRQYRYPYQEFMFEIPAGKLEGNEDIESALKRELKEEIGIDQADFKKITIIYPTVGYSNEKLHLFLAKIIKRSNPLPDADEYISVYSFSLQKCLEMIQNNTIKDSKTIIGILMFKDFLK